MSLFYDVLTFISSDLNVPTTLDTKIDGHNNTVIGMFINVKNSFEIPTGFYDITFNLVTKDLTFDGRPYPSLGNLIHKFKIRACNTVDPKPNSDINWTAFFGFP